jgi:hypothetical protein
MQAYRIYRLTEDGHIAGPAVIGIVVCSRRRGRTLVVPGAVSQL